MKILINQVILEAKLFIREPILVFWNFGFPAVLMILIGWFFLDTNEKGRLYVYNSDLSHDSIEFVNQLKKSSHLEIKTLTEAEFIAKTQANQGELILKIDGGFKLSYNSKLTLYYNQAYGSNNELNISLFYQELPHIINSLTHQLFPFEISKVNLGEKGKNLSYINFLCPGVIAMSVMSTSLFGIGIIVASYREKGKLRRLALTPLKKSVFILAQIIHRYFIVLLQAIILIGLAHYLFGLNVVGDILSLTIVITIGLFTFISIGFLVASRTKKSETAAAVANLLFFPMLLLGGVYFPLDKIPDLLKPIVEIIPLSHLTESLRQVINYGVPFYELNYHSLAQLSVMIVCFVISIKTFSWE